MTAEGCARLLVDHGILSSRDRRTGMIAARLAHGLGDRGVGIQIITRQVVPASPRRELIGTVHVRRVDPAGRMKGAGWRAVPAMLSFILRVAAILCVERRRFDIVMVSGMKTLPLTAFPSAVSWESAA